MYSIGSDYRIIPDLNSTSYYAVSIPSLSLTQGTTLPARDLANLTYLYSLGLPVGGSVEVPVTYISSEETGFETTNVMATATGEHSEGCMIFTFSGVYAGYSSLEADDWVSSVTGAFYVDETTGDISCEVRDTVSSYAIPTNTSDLTNDSGFISSETDPTVPSWAKASTKPSYTASEVGALPNTGEAEFTGASSVLILKGGAAENSPALRFQRGSLTDNYNDWQMQDRGGFLYFEQRGNGSSAWSEIAHFDTTGNLYCTGVKAYLDWSYVSNKPTIPTVDATPTSGSTNAVSSGGVYDMIGDVETLLASI
jgi:hypothetical protein